MDIAPTFLDVAGATYPTEYSGHEVSPMMGKSLLPFIQGKADVVREEGEAVCWELLGFRAVRQGKWKATWLPKPFGLSDWELFDLETDISERNNLAKTNAEKLRELAQIWENYAESVGLIMPDPPVRLVKE
jgi:arylsulfatase